SYYKFSGSGGMGLCSTANDSSCVSTGAKRLVWEFNFPSVIRGSVVSSAEFSAYKTHSYACGDTGAMRFYRVNAITSSTNWSNHHAHWDNGGSAPLIHSKAPNGNCTGWERFNATQAAQDAANATWATLTVGLRAGSETSMPGYWKQFRNDATLSITFNRYPNTAGTPSLDPSVTTGSGPSGYFVRDSTPTLRASVSDPDGAYGQTVRGVFQIYNGSTKVWEGQSALAGSGSTVSATSSVTLQQNILYTVRVWAQDASGLRAKAWSNYIQFKVDTTPPQAQPGVEPQAVGTGIDATYEADAWAGQPGKVGKFRFTPNGVPDVHRYRYSFDSTSYTHEVAADAVTKASVSLVAYTPSTPGVHTLRVWIVDTAGWVSAARVHTFWVYVTPRAGWWLLDGNGTDAASGGAHPLTTSGTVTYVDGPLVGEYPGDRALHADGVGTSGATVGPVVHTSGSFTVTALVNTTAATGTRVAVSQDGVNVSGFTLGQINDATLCPTTLGTTCWAFSMANQDVTGSVQTRAVASVHPEDPQRFAVEAGTWTALAGVYDATAQELRLYVNGELAGVTPYAASWDAVGQFRVGRTTAGGTAQQFWSGDLDDVRAYRAALDDDTIRRVAIGSRDAADVPQ
ncbi:MAG TPA: LamG domain-containing protein, partial [Pilimelia sp.]|nr:LamG domain-containing protein [Pilimelia sp.]